jgi:glycosyltransferase involved in cell wall biosynthesis
MHKFLLTSNEGWGLSLTEALLTGTPIIANVTGGMQDQMRFVDENGNWFTPSAEIPSNHTGKYKNMVNGLFQYSQQIVQFKDHLLLLIFGMIDVRPEDAAEQIMNLIQYVSKEERQECGLAGLEWAAGEEAGFTSYHMAQRAIKYVDQTFETFKPRLNYEFINVNEVKEDKLPHKLLY